MALGSHKHLRMEPGIYQLIVNQAIEEGINVIEAGQDEGPDALANVLLGYKGDTRLTLLNRMGYIVNQESSTAGSGSGLADTVVVETIPVDGANSNINKMQVVHHLSGAAVETFLKESPLMGLVEENLDVIPMIHNPEEHGGDTLSRLTDAFCGLEQAVAEQKIPSFGIVSNGLSLPRDHPLHLDWKSVVFKAASDAAEQSGKDKSGLSILQLPANLLETRGLQVARDINSHVKGGAVPRLPKELEVYLMRPLTCFPDQGTGEGQGFQLMDYQVPTEPGITEWTHEMTQAPPVYPATYKTAVSYFDATELLEAKQERKLTEEEEETLMGAKILLEMIQDMDATVENARSFAQHEQELLARAIPVIDGTFDEIDDESLEVLQNFFASLGLTARYHVARNTRSLLMKGGAGVAPSKMPSDMKMQDFALKELLKEKAVSKIIVGATKPEHVRDTMKIFKQFSE